MEGHKSHIGLKSRFPQRTFDPRRTLLPAQWIAQCADRLHQRWRTVEPAQLGELAMDLWKDVQLRAMPPEEAAAAWLSPVEVKEDTSAGNNGAS